MSNSNFEPMPFRRQFGSEAASNGNGVSDGEKEKKARFGQGRTLADLQVPSSMAYDPNAFIDASGNTIAKAVVTGACRKCGYPGHMTYQCRNYIQLKPNVTTTVHEVSSTSTEDSDDDEKLKKETPLMKHAKKKLKDKKKSKKKKKKESKKEKKSKKKRKSRKRKHSTSSDSSKSSEDDSDSDSEDDSRRRKSKHRKRRRSRSSSRDEAERRKRDRRDYSD